MKLPVLNRRNSDRYREDPPSSRERLQAMKQETTEALIERSLKTITDSLKQIDKVIKEMNKIKKTKKRPLSSTRVDAP